MTLPAIILKVETRAPHFYNDKDTTVNSLNSLGRVHPEGWESFHSCPKCWWKPCHVNLLGGVVTPRSAEYSCLIGTIILNFYRDQHNLKWSLSDLDRPHLGSRTIAYLV